MFWLRAIGYLLPFSILLGAYALYRQVDRLRVPVPKDVMTCAIREPIGPLNPFASISGSTREVRDLLFDPLLIRDDDLVLRSHILDRWEGRTILTIRCDSEEAAGESEAKFRSGEYLREGQEMVALERVGSVLTLAFSGFDAGLEKDVLEQMDQGNLGDYLLLELTMQHSVRESLESFLSRSVEKSVIRMVEYEDDKTAYLFLRGETDLLLKELELYFESNKSLDPEIRMLGERCHTSAREMLLTLRNDVHWHDGHPVTTEDLMFSYELLTRGDSPMPLGESFWFVEGIETLDDQSISLDISVSPATMLESWEKLPLLPAHRLRGKTESTDWESYFRNPISCGPYRVARRLDDGGIELRVHEGYFLSRPLQERIVYRRFDSLESKLLALRSEEIDTLVADQRFEDWASRNPGVVRPIRGLPRFQHFVAWNLEREPFSNRDIRLALAEAIDLEELLEDSVTEFQQPVRSLFFPGSPFASETMALPLYDPRAAERRLDQAGFLYDEEKGIRSDSDGNLLSWKLTVNEANAGQVRMAEKLAEQWSAIGAIVEVEPLSWVEMLTERLSTREFQALLISWEIPLERDRYLTWHSQGNAPSGGNLFGMRNQLVDESVLRLRTEENSDLFPLLGSKLQESIAELQPVLFLCDTGRILYLRSGAVEMARPMESGAVKRAEVHVGKAGLARNRLWWVRAEKEPREKEESPR